MPELNCSAVGAAHHGGSNWGRTAVPGRPEKGLFALGQQCCVASKLFAGMARAEECGEGVRVVTGAVRAP